MRIIFFVLFFVACSNKVTKSEKYQDSKFIESDKSITEKYGNDNIDGVVLILKNNLSRVELLSSILFSGIPGTSVSLPLIASDKKAIFLSSKYYTQLKVNSFNQIYVVSESDSYIAINHHLIRNELTEQGLIEKFGIR